jgi:Holliday junction resolvase RusA-like endonuclease
MILFRTTVEVEKHVTKKNKHQALVNRKTGAAYVYLAAEAVKAQTHLTKMLQLQKNRQIQDAIIECDITCTILFYFDDYYTKKGERNKRLPDLDNLFSLPCDSLTKSGLITDDSIICSFDGSRRLPGKTNCVEIIISDFAK